MITVVAADVGTHEKHMVAVPTSEVSERVRQEALVRRELEAHLGVRLFHRTTRRMSLTEEGSLYYERIARVLDELEDADGALSAMRDAPVSG